MSTSQKSRVEQVDELIYNLTESSDHLAQLAGITENVADLAGRQEDLLYALSESTRVVKEAGANLNQSEQRLTKMVGEHLLQVDQVTVTKLESLRVSMDHALAAMSTDLSATFQGGVSVINQSATDLTDSERKLRETFEKQLSQFRNTTTAKLNEVGTGVNLTLETVQNFIYTTQSTLTETVRIRTDQVVELTDKHLTEIQTSFDTRSLANERAIDAIRQESRQHYLDQEKLMRIKLEESRSEIKQLIESERMKVRELVEEQTKIGTARLDQLNQNLISARRSQWLALLMLALLIAGLIAAFLIKF